MVINISSRLEITPSNYIYLFYKQEFYMAKTHNPLSGFFRTPKIYTKLPSLGRYYTDDVIDLSDTGELAVYPMTAKDEVILKNPDNGLCVFAI